MKDASKVENKVENKNDNYLTQNQQKILELLKNNPYLTLQELSKNVNISETSISNNLKKLENKKVISRVGARKNGYWQINGGKDGI